MKKTLLYGLLGLSLILVLIGGYLKIAFPKVDAAPHIQIEQSSAQLLRGAYLANHVLACMDCHSERDWTRFSGPIIPGSLGKGGEYFGPEIGFPGRFYSKNISPANLHEWSDGEIFRAITTGVNKKGEALFPVMPYQAYGQMTQKDVEAIIVYLRSLKPIPSEVSDSKADFPMNFILNTLPKNAALTKSVDSNNKLEYGRYLVNIAACVDCHSPVDKGQVIIAKAYSGGREFKMPNGIVRSSNITPDMKTGIGEWTEAQFIQRFRAYAQLEHLPLLEPEQVNTIMPWSMYAHISSTDLAAMYTYLKSLKPIHNPVIKYELSAKN